MKVSVIIPSLNPDSKLVEVVESLIRTGFDDIIIVNDGSDESHLEPFELVSKHPECTILTHEVNKGKGRGLKTAFEFCLKNRPEIDGVVTVDGDNQHKANDILNCCEKMIECKDKVILGVRNFKGDNVPFKSRFGNNMTSFVFKFICGLNISDTQTGLRAIPYQYLQLFDEVKGERFEYETNMLLEFRQSNIGFVEVPIETVYIEENASTHFNPVKDSLKIYGVIFKFLFSSLASSIIDLAMFSVLTGILFGKVDEALRILLCTVIARIISSVFNYTFNRKAVFKAKNKVKESVIRYYILCVLQLCASYGLVFAVTSLLSLGAVMSVVAKAVIDVLLFLISFQIQRRWVFK
ncbi:MAG: bifunctional glycosyltransferase family 2/GtrA family protein [Lachnospira sp.]|nr:bifunctional glycosyltransferase family 2/GtrA family protein [Lachnospira sp.]MDD5828094.1 bifunctional glycosyltransferase family 2/GtrA family protein [Lachnospira sp.]